MEFDRFDICEAWWVHACDYGEYGIITRLTNMTFKPRPSLRFETLEENELAIYEQLPVIGPYDTNRRGITR